MKGRHWLWFVGLLALGLAACVGAPGTVFPTPIPGNEPDRVAVEVLQSQVLMLESYPVQVVLRVAGNLPSPCHELGWEVAEPDAENRIYVELYGLIDPQEVCAQVLQPFEVDIPLGSFSGGSYTVWLYGEEVGNFDLGGSMAPTPGSGWVQGPVFVDKTEILLMESYPVQVVLMVEGSLPTPCHTLQSEVLPPDAQGRIEVELYSLADPEAVCIQVLQSFQTRVRLGDFTSGSFTVWLNGEQVGQFTL